MQETLKFESISNKGFDPLPEQLPPGFISFDTETDGLDLRGKSRPFCFSIATDNDSWCCEWDTQWLIDNLTDRDVVFCNAKFDVWAALQMEVDFEAIGVRPHDVQHCALLLDDHRRKFSLDTLSLDRLGKQKIKLPHERVCELPVPMVVVYARQDARLTYDLWKSYAPDIQKEGLEQVQQLEDALIYCTLAMERNGCPLDIPKLERWVVEVKDCILQKTLQLWHLTGLRINPDTDDMKKLCAHLGITYPGSRSADVLARYRTEPAMNLALEIRELKSWLSKCGDKYLQSHVNGVLHYRLHQLRCDEGGTITGRYAGDVQQVFKPDKQPKVTQQWIVRELFTATDGLQMWDADASQIEYRLFAHFSRVPYPHSNRLINAYQDNPDTDFHDFVTHDILKDIMIRSLAKNVSFAKLYGGGVGKISAMTGLSMDEAEETVRAYDRAFPEASRLLNYCTKLAESRGYVRTMLGRRRRYFPGDRFYSALNSILQGTAADAMKLKLLALYNDRKTTGTTPLLTNHDETLGDITESYTMARVTELLAEQSLKTRVPLTWDIGVGKNWAEAMK